MSKRILAFILTILLMFSMSASVLAFQISFKTEDDVYINTDKTGWRFKLTMSSTTGSEEACLFIALYDENNRLMSLRPFTYKQSSVDNSDGKTSRLWWNGRNGRFNGNIMTDVYPDRYPATLKIFGWTSMTSIHPITNCATYVIPCPPSNKAIIVKDMQGFIDKLTEIEYTGNTADIVNIMVQVGTEVYDKAAALGTTEDLDIEQLKIDYSGSRAQLSNIYHNLMGEQERVGFQNKMIEVAKFYPDLKNLIMDIFNISI